MKYDDTFGFFLAHIRSLPLLTPRIMYGELEKLGYIGQERARKAVCLMAYRHINRIKKIYLDHVNQEKLPPKGNMLLLGPTGCGKTFLIELLFHFILKIPAVIIDITSYSETGYVGQDVSQILTRLVHAAGGNPFLASIGIVCIDEFDKISSGKNSAVFSGQGTTKDVTGIGVQRELLKMLENSDIDISVELSHSGYAPRISFNTANVVFIACGAFSGFKKVLHFAAREETIGFNRTGNPNGISELITREDVEKAAHFEAYGILPELTGRFARIIPFSPLSREELRTILDKGTVARYRHELALDGIQLDIANDVFDFIVDKARNRETGARALEAHLIESLEDACFEAYSEPEAGKRIVLYLQDKKICWNIGKETS